MGERWHQQNNYRMEFSYFLGSSLLGERHNVHLKNTLLLNFGIKKEEVMLQWRSSSSAGHWPAWRGSRETGYSRQLQLKKDQQDLQKAAAKTQRDKELSLIIIQQLKGKLSADKAPRKKKNEIMALALALQTEIFCEKDTIKSGSVRERTSEDERESSKNSSSICHFSSFLCFQFGSWQSSVA